MNNLADMLVSDVVKRADRFCGQCEPTDVCDNCKLSIFIDQIKKETYTEGYKDGEQYMRSLI
jgi:hypothetical protein